MTTGFWSDRVEAETQGGGRVGGLGCRPAALGKHGPLRQGPSFCGLGANSPPLRAPSAPQTIQPVGQRGSGTPHGRGGARSFRGVAESLL